MCLVVAVKPAGDKETRLIRHSVKFESRRVRLRRQAIDHLQERMDEPGLIAYYRMEHEKLQRGEI